MTSAASAGVAIPPAEKFGTGSLPLVGDPLDQFERRAELLRFVHQFLFAEDGQLLHLFDDGADVADRFDDVAGAGFALGADHGRAFRDAAQGFAEIAGAADERDLVGRACRCDALRRPG